MYLGIDIGGTKTLVARLSNAGVIEASEKFPTLRVYPEFLQTLSSVIDTLGIDHLQAAGVAAPGKIDRKHGIAEAFGNLPWKDIPIKRDIERIAHCPVVVENDANLAGLSEAMLLKQYDKILYITISTGIGTGIITKQTIDPYFADSEGGEIMLEHNGKLRRWEDFASGRAIVTRFGKKARDITDDKTWHLIARDLALGFFDLITLVQPDAVVVGGSVGSYFERYSTPLKQALKRFETPITPIPPIYKAQRPEEAVVYGCYDLAKSMYGSTH